MEVQTFMTDIAYRKIPKELESIGTNDLSPDAKRRMILGLVESLKGNELVEVSKDISGKPFEIRPGIEYRKQYQLTKYKLLFKNIHEFERIYKEVFSIMKFEGFDYFQYAVDQIKDGKDQDISYSFEFVTGPYKENFEFKYEKKHIPEFEINIKVKEDK